MTNQDLSNFSMLDLFRMELETQVAILNNNLLALETQPDASEALAALMRAAHSIKGAARIVQIEPVVKIAHVMEDCFVAAQQRSIVLSSNQIDTLLRGVDLLLGIAQIPETELENWRSAHATEVEAIVAAISATIEQGSRKNPPPEPILEPTKTAISPQNSTLRNTQPSLDRGVRISGENLNRLMGLAGESLVEANWVQPFSDSLQKLRQQQGKLSKDLEKLQNLLADFPQNQPAELQLDATRKLANECYQFLTERINELEGFARRTANLSDRLYREAIATQMRPFADGVESFPRMVRDLARQLGKQVKFEILGQSTQVDRDILEKLEAPLLHILRNAIDHGIESPQERLNRGKPPEGIVQLEAVHQAGMLLITVSDDGRGVDLEQLSQKIVSKGMVSAEVANQLTETELIDFLFLPGFSTAKSVTEISGRGVGLDIVQSMVQQVGGKLRAISNPGKGIKFHLQLPLTLSVIRTVLVEISGEVYAFAITRIERLMMIPKTDIFIAENRQFFRLYEQNVGLVSAHQVLNLNEDSRHLELDILPVVIISSSPSDSTVGSSLCASRSSRYGVVVDRFLGARDLVVRPLDPRLGKVQDISAAALMQDGSIVLIVDVEDLVRSLDKLLASAHLSKVSQTATTSFKERLRILVVDDSITVREVERKLLENNGYEVEVAVDGMDAWNAIRTHSYDLVVTDIDMPRLNGIELVTQIKNHPSFKSLPVIIVSYKDREEDYMKGLDVGANYYLTKSSFHDDTLLKAVIDLIGI
jgi:two-component system sensor histidine kinase and response regulator WspE